MSASSGTRLGAYEVGSLPGVGGMGEVYRARDTTLKDLRAAAVGEKGSDAVYLQTTFNEQHPWLSPDPRWIAYTSDQSGRSEVYVQAFPGPGGRSQVSTDGGTEPVWARSGRELFYREGDKVVAVAVESGPAFKTAAARVLFEGRYASVMWGEADYDVSPDGQRFLMTRSEAHPPATELRLVMNWHEELKRLVPTK